jgi:hypothetical protein
MYLRCVQYSDGGTTERVDGGNSNYIHEFPWAFLFHRHIHHNKEIFFSLLIAQSIVYLIILI